MVCNIEHTEVCRIVEQPHIHTAAVRGVMVHYLQIPFGNRSSLYQIVKHTLVLNFAHTYYSRHHIVVGSFHLSYAAGQIVDFRPIALAGPLTRALG